MLNQKWKNDFGWSKSQQSAWEECKLKYYYRYVKKWDALPTDERDMLWSLGKLQNISMLKGSFIHNAIKEQVTHHRLGRLVSPISAKNFFSNKIYEIRNNPKKYIVEAFNGLPIYDSKFDGIVEDGLKQLDTFFKIIWHNYSNLQYISHEEIEHFKIKNIKVWVNLDLLSKTRTGDIVITDWKTGYENTSDEMQAEVYALWAKNKFGVSSDNIVTEFVYLKAPTTRHVKHTENTLKMREDVILLNASDILNAKNEGDFLASPHEIKCQRCNFATICQEGKKFL